MTRKIKQKRRVEREIRECQVISEEGMYKDLTNILMNDEYMIDKWSSIDVDTRMVISKLFKQLINIYIQHKFIRREEDLQNQ